MPKLKSEVVIAVSALVVSICALVVSFNEIRIMREQQHMSVWPRLDQKVKYSSGDNMYLEISVANKGIGPAIISSEQWFVDGQPSKNWKETCTKLIGKVPDLYNRDYLTNDVILPGEKVMLFNCQFLTEEIRAELSRLTFEITYCSVYGDCWVLNKEGITQP